MDDDFILELVAQAQLDIYVGEVRQQCQNASFAAADMNHAWTLPDTEQGPRLFFSAQSLLSAAAMVSKLLYPVARSGERGRRRGEKLRTTLQIGASPLVQSRGVRDAFEHFDERLDEVLEKDFRHPYIDQAIGPTEMFQFDDGSLEPHYLRRLDTDKGTVSVLDASVHVNDLVDELLVIRRACDRWLAGELPGRIRPVSRTVVKLTSPS